MDNEIWLSIVGFLVVIGIIYCIMSKKLTTMVALSLIPLAGAILVGHFSDIPSYVASGISTVATNGVMFCFAILFFGTMMTAGAFDPIVNFIVKICRGNPLYVCLGTYALSLVGHLDGSATTTVLLVCGAMIPIYKKMNMRLMYLACILAMGSGLMNMFPWGGPTLRAATVMNMDLTTFFQPMMIPILITICVGVIPVIFFGRSETKRLKAEGFDYTAVAIEDDSAEDAEKDAMRRPKLVVVNLILVVLVIALMISGVLTPAASFLVGTAVAWLINYRKNDDQQTIMKMYGSNVVFVVSALYGAGVLMGVLSDSGMAAAMANTLVVIIPNALSQFIPVIIGAFSVPLSLLFDADTFYYGVIPVLTQSAAALGISGTGICYAALTGELTLGWAITPLTPATLLMCGMCGLDLGEHQKFTLKYVWGLSIVLLVIMILFGLII